MIDIIKAVVPLIKKIIPDREAAREAEERLRQMDQDGELEHEKNRIGILMAEARSDDPWVSRARPTFLYVMYAMILWAIPHGIIFAVKPEIAEAMAAGTTAWLSAIPSEMWGLFGVGFVGYAYLRTSEKRQKTGLIDFSSKG